MLLLQASPPLVVRPVVPENEHVSMEYRNAYSRRVIPASHRVVTCSRPCTVYTCSGSAESVVPYIQSLKRYDSMVEMSKTSMTPSPMSRPPQRRV